jgi:hypothetical protein
LERNQSYIPAEISDSIRFLGESQSAESQRLALQAREALQEAKLDPEKLASLIEGRQTPVYCLKSGLLPRFALMLLRISPGFLPFPAGIRGKLLRLALYFWAKRPAQLPDQLETSSTHGLFILTPSLFSTGFMAYQLHHWLAFQAGLGGYCEKAQRLYERFWTESKGILTSESIQDWEEQDLLALRAAIRQEMSALEFFRALIHDVLFLTQPSAATFESSRPSPLLPSH